MNKLSKLKILHLLVWAFVASFLPVSADTEQEYGAVREVISSTDQVLGHGESIHRQILLVELSSRNTIEVIHDIPLNLPYQLKFKAGDKVILHQEDGIHHIDSYRIDTIAYILIGVFVVLVCFIGGKQGVLAIVSLCVQGGLLFWVLIPSIKQGLPPVLISSIFCGVATLLTMLIISGFSKKALASSLGTLGGVVLAGILGIWAVYASHLTGLIEQETQSLFYQFPNISLPELIAAGVLIGALGATMDVSMSIASSLYEIQKNSPNKTFRELYDSGMNIGKDIMGTMVNTLILAYAGSAIVTIILISELNISYLLNTELLMKEIILAFVGSIGLILTIPFTAAISSFLYTTDKIR